MPPQGQMMAQPCQVVGGGGWVMPQQNMTNQSVMQSYTTLISAETLKRIGEVAEVTQQPLELNKSLQIATSVCGQFPALNRSNFINMLNQFCQTVGMASKPDSAICESLFATLAAQKSGAVSKNAFVLLCVHLWLTECQVRSNPSGWQYNNFMEHVVTLGKAEE